MRSKQEYEDVLRAYPNVPARTLDALYYYTTERRPVGDFLKAVLSNNLFGAIAHADEENAQALGDIVRVIFNHLPTVATGCEQAVEDWLTPIENETEDN